MNDDNYCLLINPAEHSIQRVHPKGDHEVTIEDICQWIDCENVEKVYIGNGNMVVFGESNLVCKPHPHGCFTLGTPDVVYIGKALITGVSENKLVGTKLTIQDVAPHIHWAFHLEGDIDVT